MDKIMSECRKKKTRRGKKSLKKVSRVYGQDFYMMDDFERCFNVSTFKSNNKQWLRPAKSPKAPVNSNQFLIEDRERCDLETFGLSPSEQNAGSCNGFHSMSLSPSLYAGDDEYYEPLWVTDTTEFMGKEFEKDYNAIIESEDNLPSGYNVFMDLSKEELVKKCMDMERRCSERKHVSKLNKSKSLKQIVSQLRSENRTLATENEKLKSFIQSRQ